MSAQISLEHGNQYPYDASDAWWKDDDKTPPEGTDWSYRAARGILADLQDRRGIKHEFDGIDENTRHEIVECLVDIIKLAHDERTERC